MSEGSEVSKVTLCVRILKWHPPTHWPSEWPMSGIELPGQLKTLFFFKTTCMTIGHSDQTWDLPLCKYICSNCKKYLSKLSHVFVWTAQWRCRLVQLQWSHLTIVFMQIVKCICPNYKKHLSKLTMRITIGAVTVIRHETWTQGRGSESSCSSAVKLGGLSEYNILLNGI